MDTKETSYSQMVTVTRLNYRSDCNFTAGTIVGVLEDNTPVKVADDFYEFHHGHYWRKIKLGRKHYYVVADWLKRFKVTAPGNPLGAVYYIKRRSYL
ncbi:MAG: hypothetical protein ACLVIP_02855 [Ruminococcus sp.]